MKVGHMVPKICLKVVTFEKEIIEHPTFNSIYATPKMQHVLLQPYSYPVTKDHEGGAYGSRDMLQVKNVQIFERIMQIRY